MSRSDETSLIGKLLLATPQIGDPRFAQAAIFICAHDEHGAMGLVVNQKMPNVKPDHLFEQLNIEKNETAQVLLPVMQGGPVDMARGFLLHSKDYKQKDTVDVNEEFSVTGTLEALRCIAAGEGPKDKIFMLGYAGWGEGQLEQELSENAWLVIAATPDLIFKTATDQLWLTAVNMLGIDPSHLSGEAGHA
ncbi:MAG: hypothetical protein CL565_06750 [Alphaproteobacteria bacterium]|nr:hypothetical protein [Alphaproteobacteria bacterium]|tara:strand:- start:2096 stop:2668 length:573 start_codon:yes stop_codon:yes gene_type:complete